MQRLITWQSSSSVFVFVSTHQAIKIIKCFIFQVNYEFSYNIPAKDLGVVAQHWEKSHNDKVRGTYLHLQPDQRVRVVEYVVDGARGFIASVKYRKPTTGNLCAY